MTISLTISSLSSLRSSSAPTLQTLHAVEETTPTALLRHLVRGGRHAVRRNTSSKTVSVRRAWCSGSAAFGLFCVTDGCALLLVCIVIIREEWVALLAVSCNTVSAACTLHLARAVW